MKKTGIVKKISFAIILILCAFSMAYAVENRVGETTITTGTGAIDLAGPKAGHVAFNTVYVDSNTITYLIENWNGTEWEIGTGTFISGVPDTIQRTTIEASSNNGSWVNFSAGVKSVFNIISADNYNAIIAGMHTPETAESIEDIMSGAEENTTPEDTHTFSVVVSNALKKITYANIKATLKTYFDSFYQPKDDDLEDLADGSLSGSKVTAASLTAVGTSELATVTEINDGADNLRTITPSGLAGSNFSKRVVSVKINEDGGTTLTTGDGKFTWIVPQALHGFNIVAVSAGCSTCSYSGNPVFDLYNATSSLDILSTNLYMDVNEYTSASAATASVINTTNDYLTTGDRIRIDCDVAGTGVKGVQIDITCQK